ncbi:MAG TPA: tetratricopeptide repeat protein [Pyrinomonadaceae bacterium]|jgi:tetratricopeptide (TPR) repeat protein
MFLESAKTPTTAELFLIIEEAKNAELCRNVRLSQEILRNVWDDFAIDPKFDYCEPKIRAELFRLCGVFLSLYGSARNKNDFQLRGKNLLTKAINIFEAEGLHDKSAEANVMLAFCYWNGGEVEECEAVLETIESGFAENQLHPVYLQSCVNRMMTLYYNEKFQEALSIIEKLTVPMEFCMDARLQAMFHNQAGIIYRSIGKYGKAAYHLNEAIRFAKRANNPLFVGINFNNLAFLYKEMSNLAQAHHCVSESIKVLEKLNHLGLLPHFLDTKAAIFLDEGKSIEALKTIEESIELFRQGEDYRGLVASLWTKVRCLFRLDLKDEALFIYTELQQIAAERIGKTAVRKYEKALADEIYVCKNLPLLDEVAEFKKSRIRIALVKFGNNMADVQKHLKIEKHQTLSQILNNQFPELYDELGIKRRRSPGKRDSDPKEKKKKVKTVKTSSADKEISRLVMQNVKFSFKFNLRAKSLETYYFGSSLMKRFGVAGDAVVAVVPIERIEQGIPLLISEDEDYALGRAEYDEFAGLFYLVNDEGSPVPIDNSNVIGIPVGYCPMADSDKDPVEFSLLKMID